MSYRADVRDESSSHDRKDQSLHLKGTTNGSLAESPPTFGHPTRTCTQVPVELTPQNAAVICQFCHSVIAKELWIAVFKLT